MNSSIKWLPFIQVFVACAGKDGSQAIKINLFKQISTIRVTVFSEGSQKKSVSDMNYISP
jgi:predicted mannosyl-3-phosphoglycerate phosphatase (HAD superfamily)